MKYFFIGFNKTATMSVYFYLKKRGLNCYHGEDWVQYSKEKQEYFFDRHDVFLDGEEADFIWLSKNFSNAKFILNTRALYDWLVSRYNHYRAMKNRVTKSGERNNPLVTVERVMNWILHRDRYHRKVVTYFGASENFQIVDFTKNHLKLGEVFPEIQGHRTLPFVNQRVEQSDYVRDPIVVNEALSKLGLNKKDYFTKLYFEEPLSEERFENGKGSV